MSDMYVCDRYNMNVTKLRFLLVFLAKVYIFAVGMQPFLHCSTFTVAHTI